MSELCAFVILCLLRPVCTLSPLYQMLLLIPPLCLMVFILFCFSAQETTNWTYSLTWLQKRKVMDLTTIPLR